MTKVALCKHEIIIGSINPCEECEKDTVLSDWKSQTKIASLLGIDEDDVWGKVFKGRNIIQEKWGGEFNYVMMYKEQL
jgi:hypothetical protein